MEFKYQQEQDPEPHDFDLEQQLALECLQQQVLLGNQSADNADRYMRKIYGAFFYTVEEIDGTAE